MALTSRYITSVHGMGNYLTLVQSERTLLYQKHAIELIDSGHAYRCFCSKERLNALAMERHALGLPIDYDRACAGVPKEESDDCASRGEPHIVRLKVPDLHPQYTDLVYGIVGQRRKTEKPQSQLAQPSYDDPVLIKSDGLPTYHLANVVDDHYMEITHVIRAVVSARWGSHIMKCDVNGFTRNGWHQLRSTWSCTMHLVGSHQRLPM